MILKYKIWDKKNEKMLEEATAISEVDFNEKYETLVCLNNRDSNGKKIYEADILKCHDTIGYVEYDNQSAKFLIWVKDDELKSFIYHYPGVNWEEWTVIGNKFENIDLLEFKEE